LEPIQQQSSGVPADPVTATLIANHRRFLAFLERRLRDRDEAEEVLQEAFVRGLEKSRELRDEESAIAWFYRNLRNALIDRYRQRERESRAMERFATESPSVQPSFDEELMQEVCDCVERLVTTLKPDYAAVLRGVELEGKSLKEFAAVAGISAGNAGVRLFRAREALRKQLMRSCSLVADSSCTKEC
jgi:RNA polymerase sigma factor (sigma-70 family)